MEIQDYLVTLGVRPADLSGLKELPGGTKDRLRPLLLLAPWGRTVPLSKALDKFEMSYPNRPYFVDIDAYYHVNENTNEAKALWQQLAHRPADLKAWWKLLLDFPNANPCLLIADQEIRDVRSQITWAREHNRTFCIRIDQAPAVAARIPKWMPDLMDELSAEGANDYAVVFEFGWILDPLTVAAMAGGLVAKYAKHLPAEVPIAVSCTSFPKDFTKYNGLARVNFTNRELIAQVQRATNHPRIVYGDWGSTKPRLNGHANTPKNRIDFPGDRSWLIARDKDQSMSFEIAAQRIVQSDLWTGDLGIWGEQLIEGTADGQAFAIDTMPKMSAARINIHLHRQAFYDHLPPPESLDEAWSDDL